MIFKLINIRFVISLLLLVFCFYSCMAFKHGNTNDSAQDTYLLVTGNKDNFGDKRLSYNKYFYLCSLEKDFFCNDSVEKGDPDFFYEYISEKKPTIEMFYINLDSVFVMQETKNWRDGLKLKEVRQLSEFEKQIYQKLIEQSKK